MRVTAKGRYALRSMIHLALNGNERPLSIRKITRLEDLSPIFLEQIFTKMKKNGLVKSIRGVGGGFLLARDATEINVKDILEAVDEGIRMAPCCTNGSMPATECAQFPTCRTTGFWNNANDHVMQYFESYSLARVISEYVPKNL